MTTPEEALALIKEGNRRFVEDTLEGHLDVHDARMRFLTAQTPLATVITCSDSRLSPAVIFDQPLGALFVIRTPGNACHNTTLAGIEFGCCQLETPLLLVMGHENCGAIQAAYEKAPPQPHLATLLAEIRTALPPREEGTLSKEFLHDATCANVEHTVRDIGVRAPEIVSRVEAGTLKIAKAVYHMQTGVVEWLEKGGEIA